MKTLTFRLISVFSLLITAHISLAQVISPLASEPITASIQNGYFQIDKTISYPNNIPSTTSHLLNLYFYRNNQGQFDMIYEAADQVYLRKDGEEQSFKRVKSGYQKQEVFKGPFEIEGILRTLFIGQSDLNNALMASLPANYQSLLESNKESNIVEWKMDMDRFPVFFQRQLIIDQSNYLVRETLKMKSLNTFDKKSFDDLFLLYRIKVNRPHSYDMDDQVYMDKELSLFNVEGDQIKWNIEPLTLFVFLPNERNYNKDLVSFLTELQRNYPKIQHYCITTHDIMRNSAPAFTQTIISGSIEELMKSHLYDIKLRFTLVGNDGRIINQWIGFYPEQQLRIHKTIVANLDK